MTDVMLDFETFGNGKNACIVQVGAAYFDRKTGEVGKTFSYNIDAKSSVLSGAQIDADTIYWWLSQDREAIESITKGELVSIEKAMTELNQFLAEATNLWSHATFDYVILSETLKRMNIKPTFKYSIARDIRTLTDLAKVDTKALLFDKGIKHNAIDDCLFQIKYCVDCFKKLGV